MKFLYTLYSFLIALPIFVVITIIVSTTVIIAGFLGDTDHVAYYLPKFWAKCAFWLFLLKVKVKGRENIKKEESYVFLANHQGYYDIFLVYGYLGSLLHLHPVVDVKVQILTQILFGGFTQRIVFLISIQEFVNRNTLLANADKHVVVCLGIEGHH